MQLMGCMYKGKTSKTFLVGSTRCTHQVTYMHMGVHNKDWYQNCSARLVPGAVGHMWEGVRDGKKMACRQPATHDENLGLYHGYVKGLSIDNVKEFRKPAANQQLSGTAKGAFAGLPLKYQHINAASVVV